jgi:hypothetical protein
LKSDPSIFATLFKNNVDEVKAFTKALDQANITSPESLTNAYTALQTLLTKDTRFASVST